MLPNCFVFRYNTIHNSFGDQPGYILCNEEIEATSKRLIQKVLSKDYLVYSELHIKAQWHCLLLAICYRMRVYNWWFWHYSEKVSHPYYHILWFYLCTVWSIISVIKVFDYKTVTISCRQGPLDAPPLTKMASVLHRILLRGYLMMTIPFYISQYSFPSQAKNDIE